MKSHLDRILEGVRENLSLRKASVPIGELKKRAGARPNREHPLAALPTGPGIIAEIKRASPSLGWIRKDLDAVGTARAFLSGGAWAVSILTEPKFFGGTLRDLEQVRSAFPAARLLRKDFVLDEYMVAESGAHGADMVLLMVSVLGDETPGMVSLAREYRLEPLVEVRDEVELAVAKRSGARLIGINNRDLSTLSVDLSVSERLLPFVPRDAIAVVESGISDAAQVARLHALGGRLFLVGESLARSPNPADTIRGYVGK
jgi:indole-3-glycerol phosphate synthase